MDEWRKFIPRSLFTARDGSPIYAILDLKDKNAAKITSDMFEDRGGSILKSPNPFTIFLTDRDSRYTTRHLKYPVFNVKWIFDCIDSVEVIDINPYLINKDSFKRRDFMDVIFEKLETSEGTLLVESQYEIPEDGWKKRDRGKPPGKHIQRRGPPKKCDHVLIEVDCLSQEDDFNSTLAMSVVTEAIENILLNERALIFKTKDELKRHDPEFENRLFKHKHSTEDTSLILLNKISLDSIQCEKNSHIAEDEELHQLPILSTSGEQDYEYIAANRTSSNPKSSSDTLVALLSSDKVISDFPTRLQKFSSTTKLQCSPNVLLLSSRVGKNFHQDLGET